MKMRLFSMLAIFVLLIAGLASALPSITDVEINGKDFVDSRVYERGETLDLEIDVTAFGGDESAMQVRADILGFEYSDFEKLSDVSHTFDLTDGDTKTVDLSLKLPDDMDKDYFDVRVTVGTKTGWSDQYMYRIHVEGERHSLSINKVFFSPELDVEAGRTLIARVRVKNLGEFDEKDVTVRVAVPALGLSEVADIKEVEQDESVTSEELYLRVPRDAKAGDYPVQVTVEYDNDHEQATKEYTLTVKGTPVAEAKPVEKALEVTVAANMLDLTMGQAGGFYPVTISNPGSEARTVEVSAEAPWADVRISPSNVVVVEGQDSETVFVYVTPAEGAQVGTQMVGLKVKSGEKAETVTLTANVHEAPQSSWDKAKTGLEIALAVLVVVLIILGLVAAFNRSRDGEEDEPISDVSEASYY